VGVAGVVNGVEETVGVGLCVAVDVGSGVCVVEVGVGVCATTVCAGVAALSAAAVEVADGVAVGFCARAAPPITAA
jgi:hypothetical protein